MSLNFWHFADNNEQLAEIILKFTDIISPFVVIYIICWGFKKIKNNMKAIILISSIFYILGVKISNKIDLIKPTHKAEKISIQKIAPAKSENSIDYKQAETEQDSVKCGGQCSNNILENK